MIKHRDKDGTTSLVIILASKGSIFNNTKDEGKIYMILGLAAIIRELQMIVISKEPSVEMILIIIIKAALGDCMDLIYEVTERSLTMLV